MKQQARGAMPSPQNSEQQTSFHVGNSIRGDQESLCWVIQRFSPLLMAQAEFRLGAVANPMCGPQDLVNDVWLIAIPKLDSIRAREGRMTPPLVRFLSSILRHRVGDLLRRSVRRSVRSLRPGADDDAPDLDVPAEMSGMVTRMMRNERAEAVLEAIHDLSEQDREILVLRGIEQSSGRDVAAILGIEESAARVRYHRAIQRLRARLKDDYADLFVED